MASTTHIYSIDTECDKQFPALLQIEAVISDQQSTIMLIEMAYLPPQSTILFDKIQQLCGIIFTTGNKLYGWGPLKKELSAFVKYRLFDYSRLSTPSDVQGEFKDWFDRVFPRIEDETQYTEPSGNDQDQDQDQNVLTILAPPTFDLPTKPINPYSDPKATWSLQNAVAVILNRFLDKSFTMSRWACGLDPLLGTYIHPKLVGSARTNDIRQQLTRRENLVAYARKDCQSTTKLVQYMRDYQPILAPSSRIVTITPRTPPPSTLAAISNVLGFDYEDISDDDEIPSAQSKPPSTEQRSSSPVKQKHSQHRTAASKKRRNYIRCQHRRPHRFDHTIVRHLNTNLHHQDVKRRLRHLQVPYVHFRLDKHRNRVVIGLKTDALVAQFNGTIRHDAFH
ncbi:unnamed protein product [Didymodactylos carnosus]|uniref:Uncharacterized protein n=4 Tax=Didymodactylos carnosus TaxID=1234261 RepID=A0A8S2UWX3_9BILA|nr:unnamed protein product [Didymodactylos carnosus]